jgi:hypothetical protein
MTNLSFWSTGQKFSSRATTSAAVPYLSISAQTDADIEALFEQYAGALFGSEAAALLEAKRLWVVAVMEREALRRYAEGADIESARRLMNRSDDERRPVTGDEWPEGYTRTKA